MKRQRPVLFKFVETKEDALKTIRYTSYGFCGLAVLALGVSFALGTALLLDAALYLALALLLFWLKSRIVAVLLLILTCMSLIVTILNRMGKMDQGGGNVLLAIIVVWVAAKAVEATWKLHTKFKEID